MWTEYSGCGLWNNDIHDANSPYLGTKVVTGLVSQSEHAHSRGDPAAKVEQSDDPRVLWASANPAPWGAVGGCNNYRHGVWCVLHIMEIKKQVTEFYVWCTLYVEIPYSWKFSKVQIFA